MATLRAAREDDWPAVERLLGACALPVAGAGAHLAAFIVAEIEGAIVGSIGSEVYGRDALLRSLAVAEGHRGRGLADALEARMIEALRARGVKRIGLLTLTAERFFERRCFKRVAREDLPAALHASEELKDSICAGGVAMLMAL